MKDFVKNLPSAPGTYKMLDKEKRVIYVGKAKNLKKRVGQYFQKNYEHSTRTKKLLQNVADIEPIQTDSELEAIILENNLIKELRPKYNILMKDDKSYAYIKINMDEDFPRVRIVRERELKKEPNAKYFGPKLATSKVFETLRILKKLFPFRHCQLGISFLGNKTDKNPQISSDKNLVQVSNKVIDFPCLDYFIKRCPGPCIGAINPMSYKKTVQQIVDFLNGKSDEIEKSLKEQMQIAAQQKLFEKAAKLRDKLLAVQSVTEHQKITDQERPDTDIINCTSEIGHIYFNILMIRNGKLINQENFILDAAEMEHGTKMEEETFEAFLSQYYEKAAGIPKEILIPIELENKEMIETWLSKSRGDKVNILAPKRGEKNKLLELSLKNAQSFAKQYRIKWLVQQNQKEALGRLAEVLNMKDKLLKRIEGFDISHLGGTDTVGSMVVFENGMPKSQHYRHFKLRTVGKPDDYASMEEVLMRRFKYLSSGKNENLKIKTPAKKDFEQIKKIIEKEKLYCEHMNQKDFMAAKLDKKMIGFGRIFALDNKISALSDLWIDPSARGKMLGHTIIKKLISKFKLKRVYIATQKELEEYYSIFGFIALHEPPQVLVNCFKQGCEECYKKKVVFMAFDAQKHKEDVSFTAKPELVVIDGGKGQLSTALLVLKRLKLNIPVISLAKKLEEIYIPNAAAPILLEEGDEALKLLQRIRDESHRFAITFQRKLHGKSLIG